MKPSEHISLVGLSGTGKSSIAPVVAERTGRVAIDLDRVVALDSGRSVEQVFANEGERAFRKLELEALRSALEGPSCVVATGGGIVTTPAAADLLSSRSTVIWLRATPQVLMSRLGADDELRPLLATDPAGRLEAMAQQRNPLYESLAEVVIDVDDLEVADVADRVVESVKSIGVADG